MSWCNLRMERLEVCGRSSTALWRSMSTLLGRHRDVTSATHHTADGFATFFVDKVERVCFDAAGLPPPPVIAPATSSLASFWLCTARRYGESSWHHRSSPARWIPYLGPYLPGARVRRRTSAVHHQDGQRVAESRSTASLTEACNRHTASEETGSGFIWHEQLSTCFQPVISKVVERAATSQLLQCLAANNLLPRCYDLKTNIS